MRSVAIDIGNTRIKTALFIDGQIHECGYFHNESPNPLVSWLSKVAPEDLIISSTAAKDKNIDSLINKEIRTFKLSIDTPLPIKNEYRAKTLGQDRIANAVAGHLSNQKASLVIDAGTCITYDWTVNGSYLGGSISPGMHMRLKAMHHFTGRLPMIKDPRTDILIGKDTEESMRSGSFFGIVNELHGIISTFKERFPQGSVLLTGGDSLLFADTIENDIFADPLLTLKGLYGILQFNNA